MEPDVILVNGSAGAPSIERINSKSTVSDSLQLDTDEWRKEFQTGLKPNIIRSRLMDAIRSKDRVALEVNIAKYKESHGPTTDCVEYEMAEKQLDILDIKDELTTATAAKDAEEIKNIMQKISKRLDEEERKRREKISKGTQFPNKTSGIRQDGYRLQLAYELQQARTVLRVAESNYNRQPKTLKLNGRTMSELHTYTNPPEDFKNVMRAVFLLLGEPEERTLNWGSCAVMMKTLNRRILRFDVTCVHPEIAARVKQIIDGVNFENIKKVSSGGTTFYIWVKGMLEEYEESGHPLSGVIPANKKKQMEILLGATSAGASPPTRRKNSVKP